MPKRSWLDYVNERPENVSGSVAEKSGADMLIAWLAERIPMRECQGITPWPLLGWRCVLDDNSEVFKGFGHTPDDAMRDAVEKARKS